LLTVALVWATAADAAGRRGRRAADVGAWRDLSAATGSAAVPARRQHALVADAQNDVYLFGGVGVDGARLDDLWRLAPRAAAGSASPPPTASRRRRSR